MNIIETYLSFKNPAQYRRKTVYIVAHHTAHSNCSINDIHRWHQDKGWSGVGYHYFIRKDGKCYRGRERDAIGAHCAGINEISIGIALEGNFATEYMTQEQKDTFKELTAELLEIYPDATLIAHKDKYATSCPEKNFDYSLLQKNKKMTYEQELDLLVKAGVIQSPAYWKNIGDIANGEFVRKLISNMARFIKK